MFRFDVRYLNVRLVLVFSGSRRAMADESFLSRSAGQPSSVTYVLAGENHNEQEVSATAEHNALCDSELIERQGDSPLGFRACFEAMRLLCRLCGNNQPW